MNTYALLRQDHLVEGRTNIKAAAYGIALANHGFGRRDKIPRVFHLNDILGAHRTNTGNLAEQRSFYWRGEDTARNVGN